MREFFTHLTGLFAIPGFNTSKIRPFLAQPGMARSLQSLDDQESGFANPLPSYEIKTF
jgi:hypothetical protein